MKELSFRVIDFATADTWKKLFDEWQIDYTNNEGTVYCAAFIKDEMVGIAVHRIFKNTCRLKVLVVLPKYQRKGIGTALWKFRQEIINKELEHHPKVSYYSAYLTPDSLHMYKKMGFEIISHRQKEFRNKVWDIYYARKLR